MFDLSDVHTYVQVLAGHPYAVLMHISNLQELGIQIRGPKSKSAFFADFRLTRARNGSFQTQTRPFLTEHEQVSLCTTRFSLRGVGALSGLCSALFMPLSLGPRQTR